MNGVVTDRHPLHAAILARHKDTRLGIWLVAHTPLADDYPCRCGWRCTEGRRDDERCPCRGRTDTGRLPDFCCARRAA